MAARVKTLSFFDLVAMLFAGWFSLEVVAGQATLGWSVVTMFIVIGVLYFAVSAAVTSELASTYPDQGGIYAWIKRAFGDRWAGRTTWWYWINVAAFVPSVLVVMIGVIKQLFFPDMGTWPVVLIAIALTWVIVWINSISLSIAKWIPTISTFCKLIVLVALIGSAIYWAASNGIAEPFSGSAFLPELNWGFFGVIGVFVYALTGCDIMASAADEMEDPVRDLPRSIFSSGALTIVFYVVAAGALLFITQSANISEANGVIDAFVTVFGSGSWFTYLMGAMVFVAFLGYILTWTIGGNRAAQEAGTQGELPKIFAKESKSGAPMGAAILIGIASTALMLFYGLTTKGSDDSLFWTFLAFSAIVFFLPYVVLSAAFLKLRRVDPGTKRPFKVPGGKGVAAAVAGSQIAFLAIAIVTFMIPLEGDTVVSYTIPLFVGVAIVLVIGEVVIWRTIGKRDKSADTLVSSAMED